MLKKVIIIITLLVAVGASWYLFLRDDSTESSESNSSQTAQQPPAEFDRFRYSIDEPGSLWWIVNKDRPLSDDYVPAELAAPDIKLRWARSAESMQVDARLIEPLEEMVNDAAQADHELMLISGYRSEDYQRELYQNYVRQYGEEEARRFSAPPGTSEHQTGLVVDLGRPDGECEIQECFGETDEGKWLASNAYKYGFIVRYTQGDEDSTGYMYEPWHFRYVGEDLASELHESSQTMEEFFNVN